MRDTDDSRPENIDDKIRAILNSPFGANHYRQRPASTRPQPSYARKGLQTDTNGPRKGNWAEARKLRKNLIRRLDKKGEAEKHLRDVLLGCKPRRRCASAACPKCTYAVQGVMGELQDDLREIGVVMDARLTLIPRKFFRADTEPGRGVTGAVKRILKARIDLDDILQDSGVKHAIGGIDFTYNVYPDDDGFETHCRPHFHGIAFMSQVRAGEKRLRRELPAEQSIPKPVMIQAYDGHQDGVHYDYKMPNDRKIRRRDEAGRWHPTKDKALTVDQQLQQAIARQSG